MIVIVAILAVLAISSYGVARERAKLDLMADEIVSLIKSQREISRSGRIFTTGDEDKSLSCHGILLTTEKPEEEDSYMYYLEAPYVAVGAFGAAYCDMDRMLKTPFVMERGFGLGEILKGSDNVESVYIMFKPPDATASYAARNIQTQHVKSEVEKITITLQVRNIGGEVLERNKKFIEFDPVSGVTKRLIPKKENGE